MGSTPFLGPLLPPRKRAIVLIAQNKFKRLFYFHSTFQSIHYTLMKKHKMSKRMPQVTEYGEIYQLLLTL